MPRSELPQVAATPIRTGLGDFDLYVFSWSENEQDNVLVLKTKNQPDRSIVRIQSACYTGEIFHSLDCDCHWQLVTSLNKIQKYGGFFIYMLKDGRGAGLLAKIHGMALSAAEGIDTADAYSQLGIPLDPRTYEDPAFVLKYFSVFSLRLLTNNPRKVRGLEDAGFDVQREALEAQPNEYNHAYLQAKATKLGHMLTAFKEP